MLISINRIKQSKLQHSFHSQFPAFLQEYLRKNQFLSALDFAKYSALVNAQFYVLKSAVYAHVYVIFVVVFCFLFFTCILFCTAPESYSRFRKETNQYKNVECMQTTESESGVMFDIQITDSDKKLI